MTLHHATVEWRRAGERFVDNQYRRAHLWRFDGGLVVTASSSPQVVPVPLSDAAAVDPEKAYVAALSSCHMLWFLSLAAARGFVVDHYRDAARGTMAANDAGRPWVARVVLRPHVITCGARAPDCGAVEALHHAAHAECFLANSVKTLVVTEGSWEHRG